MPLGMTREAVKLPEMSDEGVMGPFVGNIAEAETETMLSPKDKKLCAGGVPTMGKFNYLLTFLLESIISQKYSKSLQSNYGNIVQFCLLFSLSYKRNGRVIIETLLLCCY
jgi:hypothetical protein